MYVGGELGFDQDKAGAGGTADDREDWGSRTLSGRLFFQNPEGNDFFPTSLKGVAQHNINRKERVPTDLDGNFPDRNTSYKRSDFFLGGRAWRRWRRTGAEALEKRRPLPCVDFMSTIKFESKLSM